MKHGILVKTSRIARVTSALFLILQMSLSFSQAAQPFKSIHIAELEKMISAQVSEENRPVLFDVNVESTRKHVGVIPGSKLLSASKNYNVEKELPGDKNKSLVFYCANKQCTASHVAAEKAIQSGYKNVYVMVDGIYGWRDAQKPLEKIEGGTTKMEAIKTGSTGSFAIEPKAVMELIKKNQAIVVDVRESEERHEVIENSKWLPMSKAKNDNDWNEFQKQLPKDKTIIFHCAAGVRSKKAADRLAGEGFKAAFFKGPDQWKSEGLPLVSGPAK